LVEYFLDEHTDHFKKEVFFKPNDIVFDPFCGSGTTLVQSNELAINAIGVDISTFNALLSHAKIDHHDINDIQRHLVTITNELKGFVTTQKSNRRF